MVKKWAEAEKQIDPLKAKFEECKSEGQLCFDKLQEVANDLPPAIKSGLDAIVENVKKAVSGGDGTLKKTIDAIMAKVGKLAKAAAEYFEKAKALYDKAKAEFDKYKGELEKLKDFIEAAKETKDYGEKAWNEGRTRC